MKNLYSLILIGILSYQYSTGQVLCIECYNQNDSISSGVHNLLANGGFEKNTCTPDLNADSFCPNSLNYTCNIADWTCTGGGIDTYAFIATTSFSYIPEGVDAVYFGSNFCSACSPTLGDTSCLVDIGCGVTGFPAGYPASQNTYGGAAGLSLQQTVNGLVPGNTYVLEFWAGGEWEGSFIANGVFAVDVGFGDTLLTDQPTSPIAGVGTEYIVQFNATFPSQTIKFTCWGHICNRCTELILDNVRLYTLAELSASVPKCASSVLPPACNFQASDSLLCTNECIDFTDLSTNATSWQWSFEGGTPSSGTVESPQGVCYLSPGNFNVTLIASNAAGSDSLTFSQYINVKSSPPTPVITQLGDTLFCKTDTSYLSYQWYDSAAIIPGAIDTFLVVSQNGNYNVDVKNQNGCNIAVGITVVLTAIQNYSNNNFISLSPNPAGKRLTVNSLQLTHGATIEIYNLTGERLRSFPFGEGGVESIDVSFLPPGIYFLRIADEKQTWLERFVKE